MNIVQPINENLEKNRLMTCLLRYDIFSNNQKTMFFKIRLYHDFHFVQVPYPATVSVAKEYDVSDMISDEHFTKEGMPTFEYEECINTTLFYFRIPFLHKYVTVRVAFKCKNDKTFVDIECEDIVPFAFNAIMFLCLEYYAWQYNKFKEIQEIYFNNKLWKTFLSTFNSENNFIKHAVSYFDFAEPLDFKSTSTVTIITTEPLKAIVSKILTKI